MIECLKILNNFGVEKFCFFIQINDHDGIGLSLRNSEGYSDILTVSLCTTTDDVVINLDKQCSLLSVNNKANKDILVLPIYLNNYKKIIANFVLFIPKVQHEQARVRFEKYASDFIKSAQHFIYQHSMCRSMMVKSNIIKVKTVEVLEKISEGATRNEVASKLYISERGVDYHIDLAKFAFGTDTIAATIYQASQFGILKKLT